MRKLIGVSRAKFKTPTRRRQKEPPLTDAASPTDAPARRHRTDDDVGALSTPGGSYLVHPPRTPNGAAGLLSGDDYDNNPTPNSARLDDADECDDETPHPSPPSLLLSRLPADDADASSSDGAGDGGGSIYAQLHAFEDKMESELLDLERFGVRPRDPETSSSSSSDKSTKLREKGRKKRRSDPDGKGERPPLVNVIFANASSAASSMMFPQSFKKGKGKSGKHLNHLSGKTTKIMSDYQAYLAEIQNAFPLSDDDDDDDEVDIGNEPAMVTVLKARENIRDSYLDRELKAAEEGSQESDGDLHEDDDGGTAPLITLPTVMERDDNYATGGGEPLYRAWSDPNKEDEPGYDLASVFGEQMRPPTMRGAKRRYQPPSWLCSKRVKKGVLGIAALVFVVVVVTIAIVHSQGKRIEKNLLDWEGDYIAELEEEEHKTKVKLAKDDALLFSLGISKGQRGGGAHGEIQALPHFEVVEEEEEAGEVIEEEEEEETVQQGDDGEGYKVFEGNGSQGDKVVEGDDGQEYEVFDEREQSKNPPEEEQDENLSPEKQHDISPDWEQEYINAIQNEHLEKKEEWGQELQSFLGHKILGGTPIPEAPPQPERGAVFVDAYAEAGHKYHPILYDRDNGWKGQSYVEALVFCEQEAGLALCPYNAVCPDGAGNEPMGGYRDASYGDWAWIPVLDSHNSWVQAGAREKCAPYAGLHGGKAPEWGLTGEGNEDVTQNIMCCMMT